MKHSLNQKFLNISPPVAIKDNAAFTTAAIDTKGYDQLTVIVALGATDIALAACKMQESEASDMTGAVDISGLDYNVSPATLPSATDDNNLFAFHIDLRGRKRYLDLVLTAGDGAAGTFATALAILSKPEVSPSSASDRGFTQELFA